MNSLAVCFKRLEILPQKHFGWLDRGALRESFYKKIPNFPLRMICLPNHQTSPKNSEENLNGGGSKKWQKWLNVGFQIFWQNVLTRQSCVYFWRYLYLLSIWFLDLWYGLSIRFLLGRSLCQGILKKLIRIVNYLLIVIIYSLVLKQI